MVHITKEQRYTIEVLLAKGKAQKFISQIINKGKSVIVNELTGRYWFTHKAVRRTFMSI